jgi:predicted peptidase
MLTHVLLLLSLFSCSSSSGVDSCPTALDGTCDELAHCGLGTDFTDCAAACEQAKSDDSLVTAACAHLDALAHQDMGHADPVSSGGSGGEVGNWDATVAVRGASKSVTVTRHFRVYVPESYNPDQPIPVLFNLGGFSVDMYYLAEYTELNRTADLNNFIVVYGHPEWRDFGSYWVYAWYVYDQAFEGNWKTNPDIKYLEAVYDEVTSKYNVDRRRVYVSGHSRGAAMSVIATFEKPELFAGFNPQAGFIGVNDYDQRMSQKAPEHKAAAFIIHGIQDPDVGVENSDDMEEKLLSLGWSEEETYHYLRLDNVTHEWQPQYNQQMWDFLVQRPLPVNMVSP